MSNLSFYDVEKILNGKGKKKKENKNIKKMRPMAVVIKDYEDFYSRLIKVSVIHVAGLDISEFYKIKENKKRKVREKVSLSNNDLTESRIYTSRFISTENRCTLLIMCNAAIYIADNIHNVMKNIKSLKIDIVKGDGKKKKKNKSRIDILKDIYDVVMEALDSGMIGNHPNKITNRHHLIKLLLLTTLIGDDSNEVEIRYQAFLSNIKRLNKIFKSYNTTDDFMHKISKLDIARSIGYIGLGVSPDTKLPKKILNTLKDGTSDELEGNKLSCISNIKRSIFKSIDTPNNDVLHAIGATLMKDWNKNGRPVEVDCLLRSSHGFLSTSNNINESKEINIAFKLYAAIVNIYSVK